MLKAENFIRFYSVISVVKLFANAVSIDTV